MGVENFDESKVEKVPVLPAQGHSGLLGDVPPPPPSMATVKMNSIHVRKLKMLLADEEDANKEAEKVIRTADKAKEKRDAYCLEIEKFYNISGVKWHVDFDAGNLVVGEKR